MALVRHILRSAQWAAGCCLVRLRGTLRNNTDSQLFYSWSTDAGVTWSPNVAVSNAFNPFEGYPNQNKIGDYITIVSDNTGGNVAYSATFNFNPNRGPTRRRYLLCAGIAVGRLHAYSNTYRFARTQATASRRHLTCYAYSYGHFYPHGNSNGHSYTDSYRYS